MSDFLYHGKEYPAPPNCLGNARFPSLIGNSYCIEIG